MFKPSHIAALTALAATTALTASVAAQELTVWDWKSGDPATAAYFGSAREAFEAAHPGATVSFVVQPHDQYYTLLGTALSSGQGPDVVLLNGGTNTWSRAPALADLSAMADDFNGLNEFTAPEDGKVYALPLTIQGMVVYYNRELYEAAGLDPDAPPTTWEELVAVCEAITAAGDVPCFTMGNKEGFAAEWFLSVVGTNTFTDEDLAAWTAGDLPWTDPKVRQIVETWVETEEMGWYPRGGNSTVKFMNEFETFMRGEAANTIGLLSDVAHWKQFEDFLGADNVGVFAFPTEGAETARISFAGGIGYAVNRNSTNEDLAKNLVAILTDAERQAIFARETGALPANKSVETSALESPTLEAILALMDEAPGRAVHTALEPSVREDWKRQSQLLLNGDATVDEVIARMETSRQTANDAAN